MIAVVLATLALGANPAGSASVKPWPIGPGPRYTPRAVPAAVAAGRPVGGFRCGAKGPFVRVHLELFVNRRAIVVPAGIGVAEPATHAVGEVAPAGCVYPARTLTPAGIVEVARGAQLRLGDLFRIWGQPLGTRRLVSFHSSTPLRAYVAGKLVRGPIEAIPLARHAQIVLELGAYVPPHPFFLFAGGDS